jgi:20S proteasome subunit alpha 3
MISPPLLFLLKVCFHVYIEFRRAFTIYAGRLHQVEYAIEAINNAGTCVGLQSSEGIVLAAEKRTVSKLLAPSKTSEKTYTIDDHISCLVAGLTADANILIHQARLASQR